METNKPSFTVPDCLAFHLEPNLVIPLMDAKDENDERIAILKKDLLLVFKEEEIKIINLKNTTEDKLYFYHGHYNGLPILMESPKLNYLSVSNEKAA